MLTRSHYSPTEAILTPRRLILGPFLALNPPPGVFSAGSLPVFRDVLDSPELVWRHLVAAKHANAIAVLL